MATNGGRSWFEGTMEVISGMAPRPSTPQPYQSRSISAPNSPARQGFPGINRLPSQDSLDRSIHNESGHGKSTAQIIRDLKAANASLSAKTASIEAQFMNQLNSVTRSFEERQKTLEETLRMKERQISNLEAWKISAEQKSKEKDAQLSKIKEESAFQRHTISDLKNQLYQMENDMEEAEDYKRDDFDRLMADNKKMAKELSILQQQVEEGAEAKQQLGALQVELEDAKQGRASRDDHARERANNQMLAELRAELDERDDTIAEMQLDLRRYADQVAELKEELDKVEHVAVSQEHYRRDEVEDLRILHDAQEAEIEKTKKELDEAREELELRDQELEEKDRELEKRTETIDSKEAEIQKMKKAVDDLQEEFDLMRSEMDEKDTQMKEKEVTVERLRRSAESTDDVGVVRELEEELAEARGVVNSLKRELEDSKKMQSQQIAALESKVASNSAEKADSAKKLSKMEKELEETKTELGERIRDLEEMDGLRKEFEISKRKLQEKVESEQQALDKAKEYKDSVTELKELRAIIESNKLEIERLRSELAEAEERATKYKTDAATQAQEEVDQLRETIKEMEASGTDVAKVKSQLREAQVALVALDDEKKRMGVTHRELLAAVEKKKEEMKREFTRELNSKTKEIEDLQEKLERLNSLEESNEELKQQVEALQSASKVQRGAPYPEETGLQAELVAAKASKEKLLASLQALEREKEKEVKALKSKLKDRDTTITALVRSSVNLEGKISALEMEVDDVRSSQEEQSVVASIAEDEVNAARKEISGLKAVNTRLANEISSLHKEVDTARADAERWKAALEDDNDTGDDYRYQVAILRKEAEENVEKVQERDRAIENLVNQSIAQESNVRELKSRISALMKELETSRLPKNKFDDPTVKAELRRLQQESEIFAGQIIEQDEELELLKRSLQARDDEVSTLKKEISDMNSKLEATDSAPANEQEVASLKNEVAELQKELVSRNDQLVKLEQELSEVRSKQSSRNDDSKRVIDLQAELDELTEANHSNRSELRDLRKQLWEAKERAGEAGDLKIELAQAKYALDELKRKMEEGSQKSDVDSESLQLQNALSDALANSRALEEKLSLQAESLMRSNRDDVDKLELMVKERDELIKDLRSQPHGSNFNEEQILMFQREIESLRQELAEKSESLDEAQQELSKNTEMLEEAMRSNRDLQMSLGNVETDLAETMQTIPIGDDDLKAANAALEKQLAALKSEIESSKSEPRDQNNLRVQLEEAEEARIKSEKDIVDSYERKLSVLNMEKDVTIDGLRKDLAAIRGRSSDDISGFENQLRMLESENAGLREQLQGELQSKNQQIYALEHTVHAQEQLVENMRAEMDQLQSGMEHATETRRGEVEEMQQEVMAIEGRAMKQEREIIALKMQLEEKKLEHKEEVFKLKETIKTMEESPLAKTMAGLQNDDRMLEARQRLEQLKWRNTQLQEENLKLGGRLERAVIEIKSMDAERAHAAELEKETLGLRQQVKVLEGLLANASRPPSRQEPPAPPAPVRTIVDKENKKDKKPKKNQSSGGGFRLFKRKDGMEKSDQRTAVSH